jgi:hypothetical protein
MTKKQEPIDIPMAVFHFFPTIPKITSGSEGGAYLDPTPSLLVGAPISIHGL